MTATVTSTVTPALTVSVCGIGLVGPGLADWASGQALLLEPARRRAAPTDIPAPARLPPTERRRAGTVVKLALAVAEQAVSAAGIDPTELATVFSSSTGDPTNCHLLCEALATPARLVSPTRFTNSVHNAMAGYWHIATKSMQASTSLAGYDASFAVGLFEAAAQCIAGQRTVLLVACDVPYPEPLHSVRPLADSFGVALVLAPSSMAGPRLALRHTTDIAATPCADAGLEALRRDVPAARALPLLRALATGSAASLVIDGLPDLGLHVQVSPA